MFTEQELEGRRKGYTKPWNEYSDVDGIKFTIPEAEREKLFDWCRPYLAAGLECSGGFVFHAEDNIVVERVYLNGGKAKRLATTCIPDDADLLKQMQADYPDLRNFDGERVGFFHLHPNYFSEGILSVGDVVSIRGVLGESGFGRGDVTVHMLVYGSRQTGDFKVTGFGISLDDVFRYKVTDGTQEART
jgi:hypothetical protein